MSKAKDINEGPVPSAPLETPDQEIADQAQQDMDTSSLPDNSLTPDAEDTVPPEPKDETPAISEQVLSRAAELGFSPEELSGLEPDLAERLVHQAEAAAFNRFRAMQQHEPQQYEPTRGPDGRFMPQQSQQAPPVPQMPGQPTWPTQQQQQPPSFEVNLNPEDYDENLVKTIKSMKDFYDGQLQQLNSSLQAQQQLFSHMEQQQEAEFTAWFDASVSELGDGSVFGKGTYQTLQPWSEQFRNREQAWQAYRDYLQYHGLPPNTRDAELLSRAVQLSRGDVSDRLKQLSDQVKANSKKTIGRPSQRKSSVDESERDPNTGLSVSTVDDIQRNIDEMLAGS